MNDERTVIGVPFAVNHLVSKYLNSLQDIETPKEDSPKHIIRSRPNIKQPCIQNRITPSQLRQLELRNHLAVFYKNAPLKNPSMALAPRNSARIIRSGRQRRSGRGGFHLLLVRKALRVNVV